MALLLLLLLGLGGYTAVRLISPDKAEQEHAKRAAAMGCRTATARALLRSPNGERSDSP